MESHESFGPRGGHRVGERSIFNRCNILREWRKNGKRLGGLGPRFGYRWVSHSVSEMLKEGPADVQVSRQTLLWGEEPVQGHTGAQGTDVMSPAIWDEHEVP